MNNLEHNEIPIQIMPAPSNLYNRTEDKDGYIYAPIVCMTIDGNGDIYFCDTDSAGYIVPIESGDIYEYVNGEYQTYGGYEAFDK